MPKIALSMISRGSGEDAKLDRALSSILPHVDAIYLTFTSEIDDKTKAIATKYKAIVSYNEATMVVEQKEVDFLTKFLGYAPSMQVGDKLFLFDKARNYNLEQISQDEFPWIIWMDTDDFFATHPQALTLHKLAELADLDDVEALYCNYLYQAEFDEQGQISAKLIEHLRERLVRNNGHFKWISPIHETLIEQVPTKKTDVNDMQIVHLATEKDRELSVTRNVKNLEHAIYVTEGKDPRHVYYLAKALFDLNKNDEAIPLILQYLTGEHKSGWPEERQQAWEYLSEIYRRRGEHNNAMKASLNALTEPSLPNPEIFLSVALTHAIKGNFELALFWVKIATQQPDRKSTLVKNEKDLQLRTLQIIFNASLNLSRVDTAYGAAQKLIELSPNDPEIQRIMQFATELRDERDMSRNITKIAQYLERHGEAHKLRPLLQSVPHIAEGNPFISKLMNKVIAPRVWDKKSVVIFCGPGFTTWTPKQLDDPRGSFLGGSEEAVVKLSKALASKGYAVTVFNDPGVDAGNYEGVTYAPYYQFNSRDTFDIIIGWRQFPPDVAANKKYYWAHDILNPLEFTKERLDALDKVIVLSDYHRKVISNVPSEKILISSNGI